VQKFDVSIDVFHNRAFNINSMPAKNSVDSLRASSHQSLIAT